MPKETKNGVVVEGYLKENNLKLDKDEQGDEVIKGSIIIAIDEFNAVKVQTYTNKFKKSEGGKREESKTFPKWAEILPEKTMSIKSYLEDNPEAKFEEAKDSASKVYARGTMEEYAVKDENGEELSFVSIRSFVAGFKKEGSKNPFKPRAEFTISLFIEKMAEELDEEGEETGRVLITGLTPNYDESVSRISYVASDAEIADFIRNNYEVNQTTYLTGDIVNIVKKIVKQKGEASFGRKLEDQVETQFTNERVIFGGNPTPLSIDDEGAFTVTEMKKGLAKREEKILDNTERRNSQENNKETQRGFNTTSTNKTSDKKWAFDKKNF